MVRRLQIFGMTIWLTWKEGGTSDIIAYGDRGGIDVELVYYHKKRSVEESFQYSWPELLPEYKVIGIWWHTNRFRICLRYWKELYVKISI